jgi:hypothetical protein
LLIGSVRDRDAQIDIPEEWISQGKKPIKIIGVASSTTVEVSVIRLEALWALKLQVCRDQDIFDLYSISNHVFSRDQVIDLFRQFMCKSLATKLKKVKQKMHNPEIYDDSRSFLEFKDSERRKHEWRKFLSIADNLIDRSLD